MPYIVEKERKIFDDNLHLLAVFLRTKGELNYCITNLLHSYIFKNGLKYDTLNDVIGILECIKQELYRTVVGKYEDKKKELNGNISILDK